MLINRVRCGALLIQGEEAGENFIVRKRRFPTVGSKDCFIEFAMREVEPGWAFVVEVGERALCELFGGGVVFWNQTRVADGTNAALIRFTDIARPWPVA